MVGHGVQRRVGAGAAEVPWRAKGVYRVSSAGDSKLPTGFGSPVNRNSTSVAYNCSMDAPVPMPPLTCKCGATWRAVPKNRVGTVSLGYNAPTVRHCKEGEFQQALPSSTFEVLLDGEWSAFEPDRAD